MSSSKIIFLELVKAGLWEQKVRLLPYDKADYSEVLQLAQEQSVVGLVAAGVNHADAVPYETKLKFLGLASQIQQRNEAMNCFIAELAQKMQSAGITSILVKGQGVAQCYERPLWRTSGDVDLLFDAENYEKAKRLLLPMSSKRKEEGRYSKHIGLSIGPWYVELHGRLPTGLSARVDKEVDAVQEDTFENKHIRVWNNGGTDVALPDADNDVFFVFTHFIKHFYKEGMSLRQICDWCRLLWTYKDSLNRGLLESRIHRAGLLQEWKAFAALAVDYLGIPAEEMPLYDNNDRWHKKGEKIINVIMEGTHGKMRDTLYAARIFPCNTLRFLPAIFFNVNLLKVKERILKI